MKPVNVVISCRNRPLYLWACLDSLYRHTKHPHRFICFDMSSDDPLVPSVIEGFRRRGMFAEIIFSDRNDPRLIAQYVMERLDDWSPYFAYIEADVVVEAGRNCWLAEMVAGMEINPKLAMLGSAIYKPDFLAPEVCAPFAESVSPEALAKLIKQHSPERFQNPAAAGADGLFYSHNPAGRFLILRSEAIQAHGLADDGEMDRRLRAAGYETAITARVTHRHLSLLHIFDYPNYDYDVRDNYMGTGLETPIARF